MRWLIAAVFLCVPGVTLGGPTYTVVFGGTQPHVSAVPLALTNGYSTGVNQVDEAAYAVRGGVGATAQVHSAWVGAFSDGTVGESQANATTDDLVISGPPGTVSGTMFFHLHAGDLRSGGYPGSNVHRVTLTYSIATDFATIVSYGSYLSGNCCASTDGGLAGSSDPTIDLVIPLTGTYPVGAPFPVSITIDASAQTYGDGSVAPGVAVMDARGGSQGTLIGLSLGDGSGTVMSLPSGYSVSSPSWGVSGNQFTLLSVDGPAGTDPLALSLAVPSPCTGPVPVRFALPTAADAALDVFDVAGRHVTTLATGRQGPGAHLLTWDGRDSAGRATPSGVYLARLRAGARTLTRRFVRLR